jgi:hypothetical protein
MSAALAIAFAVAGMAACSAESGRDAATRPSVRQPSRSEVLQQAVQDPHNVDVTTWAGISTADLEAGAQAVCADLAATGISTAEVWAHVQKRFPVSTSNADYFTRASAKLYCPGEQRAAGEL